MTKELVTRTVNKIPQDALKLINEISGLNAIIPNMEDDPSIIESYFSDLEDKEITNLQELYNYKNQLEITLKGYSANPLVQNYLQELEISKGIGNLNCKISKLEKESKLGGKILREVWTKVKEKGFVMNHYLCEDNEHTDYISIFEKNRDVKICYDGTYDTELVLSPSRFGGQVKDKAELFNIYGDGKTNLLTSSLDQVLYGIGSIIMNYPEGTLEKDLMRFSKAILNLPTIMNDYMEKSLGK